MKLNPIYHYDITYHIINHHNRIIVYSPPSVSNIDISLIFELVNFQMSKNYACIYANSLTLFGAI